MTQPLPHSQVLDPTARTTADPGSGTVVVVCCGDSGAGKTTWCRELALAAHRRRLSVAGVLTWLERSVEGASRWVESLTTGERRLLGREDPGAACTTDAARWQLSDETLIWGDAQLRTACPTDVLVIDELGPVELLHGRGWLPGAGVALEGPWRLAVITVRPLLMPQLKGFLGDRPITLVSLGEEADPVPSDDLLLGLAASPRAQAGALHEASRMEVGGL